MDNETLGLNEFGFWLALAIGVVAWIWSDVRKKQMKHEMTLKLLEKGQDVEPELLTKLLASDKPAVQQKSIAEQRREASGVGGFLFLVAGLIIAVIGILGGSELVPVDAGGQLPGGIPRAPMMMFQDTGPNWLLVGLGALSFLYGNWIFYSARKEYEQAKAEEKASRD